MNTIKYYDKDQVSDYSGKMKLLIKDYRKVDLEKIDEIIPDMFSKIQEINPEYSFEIKSEVETPTYLNLNTSFIKRYTISQKFKDFQNEISFITPDLVDDNYFILNNILYVPLLLMEKAPIDRIYQPEKNNNKLFINLNPVYNITLDMVDKKVKFKNKTLELDLFLKIFYEKDIEYLEYLKETGYIENSSFTNADFRKFIKFLNFHKVEYFEELRENGITIDQWMDKYLLLEYYRETFEDYFQVNTLQDIVKKVIELNENKTEIDMANICNRRIVLMEYLYKPLFEIYVRLLYGIIDKNHQNFLPTLNELSIFTTGFNKNLHRGNIYDLSLPYPSPLIHKLSQDISIITDGRLPKSWQTNHPESYMRTCPISVSAQKTALNLVSTTNTRVNKYGRVIDEFGTNAF